MNTFLNVASQPSTKSGLKAGVHTTRLYDALNNGDVKIEAVTDGFNITTIEGTFSINSNVAMLSALQPIYTSQYDRVTWLQTLAGGFLSTQQATIASGGGVTKKAATLAKVETSKQVIKNIVIDLLNDSSNSLLDELVAVAITGKSGACNMADAIADRVDLSNFHTLYDNEQADRDLFSYFESVGFHSVERAGVELTMKVDTVVASTAIPEIMKMGHNVTQTTTDWNAGVISLYVAVNVPEQEEPKEEPKSKATKVTKPAKQ